MDYSEIDTQAVIKDWKDGRRFVENNSRDFKDLDNIVDGVPVNHDSGNPYVGDTTIAGLVRAIPRASIQQLPIFGMQVNGTKNNIPAIVSTYLLRRYIFNENTFGKGLLSTLQIGGEQALTHGFAAFMAATSSMYDDFGTTMRLIHYTDIAPEPGIQDANEAGHHYTTAHIVKSKLQRILRNAKNNPNTTWNVPALEKLLESEPDSSYSSTDVSEARGSITTSPSNAYDIVTRYETGKGGRFVTFSPQMPDEPLRVLETRSKFGYPRVLYLVIDPAPLTPFGVSRVRLASPHQNLMNAYLQNIAAMFLLNSAPPIFKRGRFTKPVQLKRNVVWEALDQNADVQLKELSNSSLQQFVTFAKYEAAQIQNIMGTPQGNVAGGDNAMGFSKTAPGVRMQEKSTDLSTNQITNILENFLRQYALVAIDTFISEQTGETDLIVDDECKDAINRLVPGTIGDDNTFKMVWEEFYDSIEDWKVDIELSLGKDELDEKKRGDMQDMLTVLEQNADPNDMETQETIKKVRSMLLSKMVPDLKQNEPAKALPTPQPVSTPVDPTQIVQPNA